MKKQFWMGLVIYLGVYIYLVNLIGLLKYILEVGHGILTQGFTSGVDVSNTVLVVVSLGLPLVLLLILRNLKALLWAAGIGIAYALLDLFVIKLNILGCGKEMCGIENEFFILIHVCSFVLALIMYGVLKITDNTGVKN